MVFTFSDSVLRQRMFQQATLHLLFLVILITLALVRVGYGRRLRRLNTPFRDRPLGPIQKELRELGAIVAGLLIVAHSVVPALFAWSDISFPALARWLAAIVAIAGVPWLWAATSAASLVKARPRARPRDGSIWLGAGPYRFTRHPVHFAIVVEIAALVILSANWVIAIIGAVWVTHIVLVRIPRDEDARFRLYGDTYADYSNVTPRFVPRTPPSAGRADDEEQ